MKQILEKILKGKYHQEPQPGKSSQRLEKVLRVLKCLFEQSGHSVGSENNRWERKTLLEATSESQTAKCVISGKIPSNENLWPEQEKSKAKNEGKGFKI